jgi:hypothetical protein
VVTLVVSGLPHGGDIGVESAGFVPPGFSADDAAYLASSCTARYIAAGLAIIHAEGHIAFTSAGR